MTLCHDAVTSRARGGAGVGVGGVKGPSSCQIMILTAFDVIDFNDNLVHIPVGEGDRAMAVSRLVGHLSSAPMMRGSTYSGWKAAIAGGI